MPLDAICLTAVKNELSNQINGMKIDKVQQPERDVIVLTLRGTGGKTLRLLMSMGADDARIHLTEHKFENPQSPPMFCMLLRKHITGARIVDMIQPPAERALSLILEASDAMGVRSEKRLVIEMIGRLSNIILLDTGGVIIDCMRRIGGELNDKRSVLPGLLYRDPPPQDGKFNPLNITGSDFNRLFNESKTGSVDKWLISTFTALSPLICREISWRAYGETDISIKAVKDSGIELQQVFLNLMDDVKSCRYEPWLILNEHCIPQDFSYIQIKQYEDIYQNERENTFSGLLDSFFTRSAQIKRIRQRNASLLKSMSTVRDRIERKLAIQRSELDETSKLDHYRQCGDIITANFHLIKKGQHSLVAEDFYSESGGLREIKLDPLKSPQQNSVKYYKAYTKAKNARRILDEQIKSGETELEYVESVLDQIGRAENEHDLNEIRNELTQTGYIKKKKQQEKKRTESLPLRFISTTGFQIYAGRNNIQNDKLTFKTASKNDIWLHAQKIHGAHVLISCGDTYPDEETLHEAGLIAAHYSAARYGSKIPVDYTHIKHVKKTPGGRPGMVIYTNYKTLTASPDEDLVKQLRVD